MKTENDHPESPCDGTPVTLATSGAGRAVACSCGNIHIDVEYVTLRFAPEAFMELADMLSHAQRRLAGRASPSHATTDLTAFH